MNRYMPQQQESEETRGFYHWLSVFGMSIKAVLNPSSMTEVEDFRLESEIEDRTVVEIGGNYVAVR